MRTITIGSLIVGLAVISLAARASELQDYVQQCESELGFNASDVQPMNCNDGVNFSGPLANGIPLPINDYLIYQRVNNNVDLAAACRWLNNETVGASIAAASVELIIHNRTSGATCFFAAKEGAIITGDQPVSVNIVSPTDFLIRKGHTNADDYWMQPTDLNSKQLPYGGGLTGPKQPLQCVGCHAAGPYIASEDIVPYLAQFGLINNGHDTVADFTVAKHYHAVGSLPYNSTLIFYLGSGAGAFAAWDSIIYSNLNGYNSALGRTADPKNECSTGCHSIAYNSTINTLEPDDPFTGISLLPSIAEDIAFIMADHVMPPTNDPSSDYRWINSSNAGGTGEYELLSDALNNYPKLVCNNPTELQAHIVGSSDIFSTRDSFPDVLHTFNMQDGLLCLNSEQSGGRQCHDWELRYLCNGAWTDWINNDSPSRGKGDYERRSDPAYANVCSSPTEMRARTTSHSTVFIAPNDRLYAFSPSYGLGCHSSDQPNGHCANYVVRFICPN